MSSPADAQRAATITNVEVSSKDQEKEGFSIPAQLKLLQEYTAKHGFNIPREFIDVETAKCVGRKQFGEKSKSKNSAGEKVV
jgi:hypothetical protein